MEHEGNLRQERLSGNGYTYHNPPSTVQVALNAPYQNDLRHCYRVRSLYTCIYVFNADYATLS